MIFYRKYVQILNVMHSLAIIFYRYYIPYCSQITYEAESRMAKPQIFEHGKKQSIHGMLRIFCDVWATLRRAT